MSLFVQLNEITLFGTNWLSDDKTINGDKKYNVPSCIVRHLLTLKRCVDIILF